MGDSENNGNGSGPEVLARPYPDFGEQFAAQLINLSANNRIPYPGDADATTLETRQQNLTALLTGIKALCPQIRAAADVCMPKIKDASLPKPAIVPTPRPATAVLQSAPNRGFSFAGMVSKFWPPRKAVIANGAPEKTFVAAVPPASSISSSKPYYTILDSSAARVEEICNRALNTKKDAGNFMLDATDVATILHLYEAVELELMPRIAIDNAKMSPPSVGNAYPCFSRMLNTLTAQILSLNMVSGVESGIKKHDDAPRIRKVVEHGPDMGRNGRTPAAESPAVEVDRTREFKQRTRQASPSARAQLAANGIESVPIEFGQMRVVLNSIGSVCHKLDVIAAGLHAQGMEPLKEAMARNNAASCLGKETVVATGGPVFADITWLDMMKQKANEVMSLMKAQSADSLLAILRAQPAARPVSASSIVGK